MKNQNDFTYDSERFAGLPEFVDELHEVGHVQCFFLAVSFVCLLTMIKERRYPTWRYESSWWNNSCNTKHIIISLLKCNERTHVKHALTLYW